MILCPMKKVIQDHDQRKFIFETGHDWNIEGSLAWSDDVTGWSLTEADNQESNRFCSLFAPNSCDTVYNCEKAFCTFFAGGDCDSTFGSGRP